MVGDAKPVFWFCAILPKLGEVFWVAREANAVDGCWAAEPNPKPAITTNYFKDN